MNDSGPTVFTVREITVFANEFVSIRNDDVVYADGSAGTHVTISVGNVGPGVVVVPLVEGKLGLVRVYRYPLGAWQWGLPRGFAHSDEPVETARIELAEEMGLEAELTLVGWFAPDSGVMSNRVAVVLAQAGSIVSNPSDDREVTEVAWLTPAQLQERLGEAPYDDGMTMADLGLVQAKGILN